ncbi:FXYD domain-containing ion transport regulator 7 isoform X2 [Dipodomys merriami]|uniref:FXYD domain-containing ion transport regulator 7 isoform X2 n=1 Tax=Dipodomys merriami TaxID=94247 RepID=UPI00385591AB
MPARIPIKRAFSLQPVWISVRLRASSPAAPSLAPTLGEGAGTAAGGGAGAGGLVRGRDPRASIGCSPSPCPHTRAPPTVPPTPHIGLSCLRCCLHRHLQQRSPPLWLWLGIMTPTEVPTIGPEEPDPFYYDYATVQTVGMTLATVMFLLGIIIIISKKVKCRKADSSPTCKSCKSELPSSAPGGGGGV